MAYTQFGTNSASSGNVTVTGTATTAGELAVAFVTVRSAAATIDSFSDDSGSNTWNLEGAIPSGDGPGVTLFAYTCPDSASFSSITATTSDGAAQLTAFLFPDGATVSPVDDIETADPDAPGDPIAGWPACEVTPTSADSTVIGAVAVQVTSRTLTQINAEYDEATTISANQLHTRYALKEDAGTDPTGPQWNIISGSAIPAALLTLAVKMSSPAPDPLSVDAGSDQTINEGQNASIAAAATGGTPSYSYAWTVQSGPSGAFADPSAASTTFTPSGGAGTYVLRCTVTDSESDVAYDDLTVTVTSSVAYPGMVYRNVGGTFVEQEFVLTV